MFLNTDRFESDRTCARKKKNVIVVKLSQFN